MTTGMVAAIWLLCLCSAVQVYTSVSVCKEAEFPCGNLTDICVAQIHQCDGEKNCPNNADEEGCVKHNPALDCDFSSERNEGIVEEFDEKRPVNFGSNITSPKDEECELEHFPKVCKCYGKTRVSCLEKNLTSVPEAISPNITHLNLLGNRIRQIKENAFRNYTKLQYLNLRENDLKSLPRDTFKGLTNLDSLYISHNHFTEILPKTFRDLSNLHWLFMGNTDITSLDEHDFYGLDSLYWLTLSHSKLENLKESIAFRDTPSLQWIDLESNSFKYLHPHNFSRMSVNNTLSVLILKNCGIEKIDKDTFARLKSLTMLELSSNKIRKFPSGLFSNLGQLETLNISANPTHALPRDLFKGLKSLQTLYMESLVIRNMNKLMFRNLTALEHVSFNKFSNCRYVPHVRTCLPRTDGISSFENLLRNMVLRVFVWTIALLTSIGNMGVFISRLMMKAESRLHSLAVINLCAADFVMSIYLFSIAIHDVMYRNNYNKYAFDWMESWSCRFSGFLAMVSGEVSVLILTFISVERCLTIAFPYRMYKLGQKELVGVLTMIWLAGATIGMIPLAVPSLFGNFYGSNGVCFPLHIHDPSQQGWEYSAFVFLAINASAFFIIFMSYIGMFRSIQKTRKATAHIGLRGDMNYAKRFFFIVLTDLLCWLPIAILKVMALCNIVVSETLYGWIVVFVLPINSALNPILYTMSTTSFTQWFHKQLKRGKCQAVSSTNGYLNHVNCNRELLPPRIGGRGSSFTETTEFTMAAVSRRSCADIKSDLLSIRTGSNQYANGQPMQKYQGPPQKRPLTNSASFPKAYSEHEQPPTYPQLYPEINRDQGFPQHLCPPDQCPLTHVQPPSSAV